VAITVRGFRHVLIPTDHLDATRSFYVKLLGLKPMHLPAMNNMDAPLDWLKSGDVELHIVQKTPVRRNRPPDAFNTTMQPHIAFEVEDFVAARDTLMREGHEILQESPIREGVSERKQLWFKDPSGMVVELYEEAHDGAPS
jgi:catechol 2,3-dioxygenase-like lactoylglutathione lyase family enzyme